MIVWESIKERVLTDQPITIDKAYREIYTASLVLNNSDGLMTPENQESSYNLNDSVYDPLLDESRKVRISQGVYCYTNLVAGTVEAEASVAPTSGELYQLTDLFYGDPTNDADTEWVRWANVASDAAITITIDLGEAFLVRHGAISFLSRTSASPQVMLPSGVQFQYSINGSTWYNCTPDVFKMRPGTSVDGESEAEYLDSRGGQRYLAWFTDLNKSVQHIRAVITNISETNDICIDEFGVWGGDETVLDDEVTFTGYLGDSIESDNSTGEIAVNFQDVRKREADNLSAELTKEYLNMRAEQIIYDLLTNVSYWTSGTNLIRNGNFESGTSDTDATDWTLSANATRVQGDGGFYPKPHVGTHCMEIDNYGGGTEYVQQDDIPVEEGVPYRLDVWYYSPNTAHWHIEIQPNNGATLIRFPDTGSYEETAVADYRLKSMSFTIPTGSDSCSVKIQADTGYWNNFAIDSVLMVSQETLEEPNAPLESTDIEWSVEDNLSGFTITKWQGQQGSILDYINELAQLIGWAYDASGTGVRRFREPEGNRTTPNTYLTYFGDRWGKRGTPKRVTAGNEIRNHLRIVGYEANNAEVTREYFHRASIEKYGDRCARITEPLAKTAEISEKLARSILRDYAYRKSTVESALIGDFDLNYPTQVVSFHEPIRAFLAKEELWRVESITTEMTLSTYTSFMQGRKYVSAIPSSVAEIAGAGGSTAITVSWTANSEIDIDGYYVYWSTSAYGPFTKRTKVTGTSDIVTGLTDSTDYWFYVTAVNLSGIESEPSALVTCKAGASNTGDESTTWGISNLAVALTDNDPNVAVDASWSSTLPAVPDHFIMTLLGPETSTPPVNGSEFTKKLAVSGVTQHWYATLAKDDKPTGVTYYWQIAISEVVVADRHHRFGTPLLSNVAEAVWP